MDGSPPLIVFFRFVVIVFLFMFFVYVYMMIIVAPGYAEPSPDGPVRWPVSSPRSIFRVR
jgi:hypothetical protein